MDNNDLPSNEANSSMDTATKPLDKDAVDIAPNGNIDVSKANSGSMPPGAAAVTGSYMPLDGDDTAESRAANGFKAIGDMGVGLAHKAMGAIGSSMAKQDAAFQAAKTGDYSGIDAIGRGLGASAAIGQAAKGGMGIAKEAPDAIHASVNSVKPLTGKGTEYLLRDDGTVAAKFYDGVFVSEAPISGIDASASTVVPKASGFAEGGEVPSDSAVGSDASLMASEQPPIANDSNSLPMDANTASGDANRSIANTPNAVPPSDNATAPDGQVQLWHVGGPKPVLGYVPHEDVHKAIASGQYSFPQGATLDVMSPDGVMGSIPAEDAYHALNSGYTYATPKDLNEAKYGTDGQHAIGALEAMGRGVLGPLAPMAEEALGVSPEGMRGRKEALGDLGNMGFEAAGLIAPALLTGGASIGAKMGVVGAESAAGALSAASKFTQGHVLDIVGKGAAKALGMSEAVAPLAKIGSSAIRGAVETGLWGAGDNVSASIMGQPQEAIGYTVAKDGLLGGLLGLGLGTAGVSASKLWKAVGGTETAKMLKAVTSHAGGMENPAMSDAMTTAIEMSGVDISPAVKSALSDDPWLRNMFKTLEQTDTTKSGVELQGIYGKFKKDVNNHLVESIGMTEADANRLATAGFDKYTSGKKMGDVLATEFQGKIEEPVRVFEQHKARFSNELLDPSISSKADVANQTLTKLNMDLMNSSKSLEKAMKANSPERAMEHTARVQELQRSIKAVEASASSPGVVDKIASDIASLAEKEKWSLSPSSDIMKEVTRVVKELPNVKTVGDLGAYITRIGENMASKNPFGGDPMSRAGSMIRSIMKDAEADMIMSKVGRTEGPEAVEALKGARDAYRQASVLKDILDDHLKAGGSTGGYSKSIRSMALKDGEDLARRLADKDDAYLLEVLSKEFPKTAEAVKRYHLEQLLDTAVKRAKGDDLISASALRKAVDSMSPQLRQFSMTPEAMTKINSIGTILDHLNSVPHNFSNTARTMSKLLDNVPGAATGMVAGLLTHNPIIGGLVGWGVKAIGKDIPDAVRLGLLKFMGAEAPLSSGGFKSMVEFFHAAQSGERIMTKATKNVFTDAKDVLPENLRPTVGDIKKLDKKLMELKDNPEKLLEIGGEVGHYLPEHLAAASEVSTKAVQYLNSLRPTPFKSGAMGGTGKVSSAEEAKFNRALGIAQQPLLILENIKKGTIVPQDVEVIKNIYPALYDTITKKLTEEAISSAGKGGAVPYKTRLGLASFMGKPLDATMTPQAIMGAQPKPKAPDAPPPGGGDTSAMNKLPDAYKTAEQSRTERSTKK